MCISLDVSFKEVYYNDGIDITSLTDYMNDEDNFLTFDSEIYGVNVGSLALLIDDQNSAFVKYLPALVARDLKSDVCKSSIV